MPTGKHPLNATYALVLFKPAYLATVALSGAASSLWRQINAACWAPSTHTNTNHRMKTSMIAWGCALAMVCSGALAERATDPLAATIQCISSGQLKTLESSRLPESTTSRSVATLEGERSVSLADGYKVILATPQGIPFVNLKLELSRPDSADADRSAIKQQMQAFASRRPPTAMDLVRSNVRGLEVLALHQPDLSRGGPVSFITAFAESRSLVATLYVLNQEPAKRAFATYEQYESLRDEAIEHIFGCIAGRDASRSVAADSPR
jgi:hypothetical protein